MNAKLNSEKNVTASLREAIRSGRLMPNQRLVEADLAAALGTNRASIRTALARLEQEGLVVHVPNRGARVRLVSDEEAVEIAQARGALEALVARQAAERVTEAHRVKLKALVAEMRDAYRSGNLGLFSQLNGRLHRCIQEIAGNQTISRILDGLSSQVVRQQYRAIFLPGRADQSMVEHARIVDCIIDGNGAGAEAAMRDHLESVLAALRRSIEISKAMQFEAESA